jgi:hypothetical protein
MMPETGLKRLRMFLCCDVSFLIYYQQCFSHRFSLSFAALFGSNLWIHGSDHFSVARRRSVFRCLAIPYVDFTAFFFLCVSLFVLISFCDAVSADFVTFVTDLILEVKAAYSWSFKTDVSADFVTSVTDLMLEVKAADSWSFKTDVSADFVTSVTDLILEVKAADSWSFKTDVPGDSEAVGIFW